MPNSLNTLRHLFASINLTFIVSRGKTDKTSNKNQVLRYFFRAFLGSVITTPWVSYPMKKREIMFKMKIRSREYLMKMSAGTVELKNS